MKNLGNFSKFSFYFYITMGANLENLVIRSYIKKSKRSFKFDIKFMNDSLTIIW